MLELFAKAQLRERTPKIFCRARVLPVDQAPPRVGACFVIVIISVKHLGDSLLEDRIRRMPLLETAQKLEGTRWLMLVPQIQPVQLEIDFALEEHAALLGLQHFAQSLLAIAPG